MRDLNEFHVFIFTNISEYPYSLTTFLHGLPNCSTRIFSL